VHGDWWEMPKARLVELMTGAGCPPANVRGANGGLWIVRREAVAEFCRQMFAAWDYFRGNGYPRMSDEPPLATVGAAMMRRPGLIEHCTSTWACDWVGRYREKLPDGRPWLYKDWQTQRELGPINPAIVHNMRGKHLMR
jgi:hypothetical protein